MKILLVLLVLFVACSSEDSEKTGGEGTEIDSSPEREIPFSWTDSPALQSTTPPIDMDGVAARFYGNIPCGPNEENVFDLFLPEAENATPLIMFIHGGGFRGGDKKEAWDTFPDEIIDALERGVAFASINYRLLDDVDEVGVYKPLTDSGHCLQFMRYHGDAFNIDPEQVALMGKSAGAGTALWLAFHEDLADPFSQVPIFEESTRVRAVAAVETQATYDLIKWSTVVFKEYGVNLIGMAELMGLEYPAPVLVIRRETRTAEGRVIEYVESEFRADRFRFYTNLKTSASSPGAVFQRFPIEGI